MKGRILAQLVWVFERVLYTIKVLTVMGMEREDVRRDMRSADKTFFFKEIGFWFDIYVFRSRKIENLRMEN